MEPLDWENRRHFASGSQYIPRWTRLTIRTSKATIGAVRLINHRYGKDDSTSAAGLALERGMPGAVKLIKKTKREPPEVRTGWNIVAPRVESGGKRTTHDMLRHHSMIHSHELLILNAYGASCWNVTAWPNSLKGLHLRYKAELRIGRSFSSRPDSRFWEAGSAILFSPTCFIGKPAGWEYCSVPD